MTPSASIARTRRPLVSIAMVTFNARPTIERAIRSVIDQQSHHAELVLVDGASTDGTLDVIRDLAPWRGCWLSEPDGGIYDAMNKALELARGDWLLFLGADDELLTSLDELIAELHDPTAVYYGNVLLGSRGTVSGGRFSTYRLMQDNICHQAILYPRAVYSTKTYDTTCGVLADYKYNIELWGRGERFVYLDRTISRYSENGVSSQGDPAFEAVKLIAIRDHLGLPMFFLKRARSLAVRTLRPRTRSA